MASTVIVDDENDIRLMVRLVLEGSGDYVVVAEAGDGAEAVNVIRDLGPGNPDIILLDNRMPELTGLQAAELILKEQPDRVIVLFSAFIDDEVRSQAEAIGIKAVVSKTDMMELPSILATLSQS